MLTQSEIARFYETLGVEPNTTMEWNPGGQLTASCWKPRPLDANEIERLMPRIVEKYPRGAFPQMHYDFLRNVWVFQLFIGDTLAEAAARWVLAQEGEACE